MSQLIVLSAIGTDRTGVVQDITKVIMSCSGNIEESRMTTLGNEFAMLMLVSGNWHTLGKLERELEKLGADDLTFTIRKTGEREIKEDRMPYAVDVVSLDHEGIVFGLANFFCLARRRNCGCCNSQLRGGAHRRSDVRRANGRQHSVVGAHRPATRRISRAV